MEIQLIPTTTTPGHPGRGCSDDLLRTGRHEALKTLFASKVPRELLGRNKGAVLILDMDVMLQGMRWALGSDSPGSNSCAAIEELHGFAQGIISSFTIRT